MISFNYKNKKKKSNKFIDIDWYYDSLEEMPLYNWNKYQELDDNTWFWKDFNGRQKKLNIEELDLLEEKLNDEYFNLVADDKYKDLLDKRLKVAKLITKHTKLVSICNMFKIGFSNKEMQSRYDYILILEKLGFTIPKINTFEGDIEEINKILNACEQLKTQIHILSKDLQQTSSSHKNSVEKQLIYLCLGLEMKLINSKDITVVEFIELNKVLKEKIEAQKKALEQNKSKNQSYG